MNIAERRIRTENERSGSVQDARAGHRSRVTHSWDFATGENIRVECSDDIMKIAYVGPFKFPSSAANSLRVWGVVQALQYLGHEVSVVGIGSETPERSLEMASDVDIFTAREYESGIFSRWPGVRGGCRRILFLMRVWLDGFRGGICDGRVPVSEKW